MIWKANVSKWEVFGRKPKRWNLFPRAEESLLSFLNKRLDLEKDTLFSDWFSYWQDVGVRLRIVIAAAMEISFASQFAKHLCLLILIASKFIIIYQPSIFSLDTFLHTQHSFLDMAVRWALNIFSTMKQTKLSAIWFFFHSSSCDVVSRPGSCLIYGPRRAFCPWQRGACWAPFCLRSSMDMFLLPPQTNTALHKHWNSWLSFQLGIVPSTISSKSMCAAPGSFFDHSVPSRLWWPGSFFWCAHFSATVPVLWGSCIFGGVMR